MRHRARVRVLTALACIASASALPALAAAGPMNGLHVDPKSPVAKEYALPLASARGAAPESGKSGKLFGSGITTKTSTTTASTTYVSPPASTVAPVVSTQATATTTKPPKPKAKPRPRPRHRTHHRKPAPSVTTATPATPHAKPGRKAEVVPAAYTVLSPGGGPGVLWMIVAGILVVVLGAAGGVALSRRR